MRLTVFEQGGVPSSSAIVFCLLFLTSSLTWIFRKRTYIKTEVSSSMLSKVRAWTGHTKTDRQTWPNTLPCCILGGNSSIISHSSTWWPRTSAYAEENDKNAEPSKQLSSRQLCDKEGKIEMVWTCRMQLNTDYVKHCIIMKTDGTRQKCTKEGWCQRHENVWPDLSGYTGSEQRKNEHQGQ